jgi:uncharacterized protein (DUF433 family)
MATARPNPHKHGRGRPRIKLPIQTIAWFHREGATIPELAASWGVSIATIYLALQEAGVVLRRGRQRSFPDLDLPDGGIGLSAQSMAYHRRNARRHGRRP